MSEFVTVNALKVFHNILILGVIYAFLYAVYMIFGDKPIVYKNFWRTYYYIVLVYSPLLAMFICLFPLAYSTFTLLLIWCIVIFLAELLVYNFFLVNKDGLEWVAFCTSKVFGYIFSGSIAVLLILSIFIEKLHR